MTQCKERSTKPLGEQITHVLSYVVGQGVPDTEHGVGAITGALTSFPAEHVFQAGTRLDDGWPESEKGDCQAIPSKEIVTIELSKSHDFFIQSVIELEVAKKLDLNN